MITDIYRRPWFTRNAAQDAIAEHIDEVGYLSYDARAADLLFEVVSRRYESKSIVICTNLAFSDWPDIFPGASCVTALIDRLTHHADICLIEGESYRRREAEEARKARKNQKNDQ